MSHEVNSISASIADVECWCFVTVDSKPEPIGTFISDTAVFVLKRDIMLQSTNQPVGICCDYDDYCGYWYVSKVCELFNVLTLRLMLLNLSVRFM